MVTYNAIKNNPSIKGYIEAADNSLASMGYTEHSFIHVARVAHSVKYILENLGYDEHTVQLGMIAAHLHDIGNLVNRVDHSQSGAVMAFRILDNMNMPSKDIATIVTAIGNHDEGCGVPIDAVCAALIIADKSDVRRNRVRNDDKTQFDIHDRVNYSVESSALSFDKENETICLELKIDTKYGNIMDYFEIFMERMILCRKAAEKLGLTFKLIINNQPLI